MLGRDRSIWLHVAPAIERLAIQGRKVWTEPAAVQKTLSEFLSVFPVTHVQIDLVALSRAHTESEEWGPLLSRAGQWGPLLNELTQAITAAVRSPVVWGLGLPGPQRIAASLGDISERGTLKAGLQLASFLQAFRESRISFVAIDLHDTEPANLERPIAPIFRNSAMYGWLRAVCIDNLTVRKGSLAGSEVTLVRDTEISALRPLWEAGEAVGGGLSDKFWNGGGFDNDLPRKCLLYGEVPEGISPKAIVETGRSLRTWVAA